MASTASTSMAWQGRCSKDVKGRMLQYADWMIGIIGAGREKGLAEVSWAFSHLVMTGGAAKRGNRQRRISLVHT
jgi:hypothetical protein